MEDIFNHAFSRRRRNRVGKNELARHTFTVIRRLFKVLLAAMYLRGPFVLPISLLLFLTLLLKKIPLTLSYSSKSHVHSTSLSSQCFDSIVYPRVCRLSLQVAGRRVHRVCDCPLCSVVHRVVGCRIPAIWHKPTLTIKPKSVSCLTSISVFTVLLAGSLTFACTSSMTVPLSACLVADNPSVPSRNDKIV